MNRKFWLIIMSSILLVLSSVGWMLGCQPASNSGVGEEEDVPLAYVLPDHVRLARHRPPRAAWEPTPPDPELQIDHAGSAVHPGGYFWLIVGPVEPEDRVGTSLKTPPVFKPFSDGLRALVPVSYHEPPQTLTFNVRVFREGDEVFFFFFAVEVEPREFEVQHLQVTPQLESTRTQANFQSDRKYIEKARAETHADPQWEGPFLMPVEGRFTTEFGVIRFVNDVPVGRHSGLDIAAPTGTPVMAAEAGTVRLAQELIVSGKAVIIDHGLDLFTSYLHLDEILVDVGDTVERGELIGEVGSTGFSTGPHLHWTVSIGHTPINPWLVLDAPPFESD